MNQIKVVWLDETVRTYQAVTSAQADENGQLTLSLQVQQGGPHGGLGSRTIHIPLANVRWWGQPGEEVGW